MVFVPQYHCLLARSDAGHCGNVSDAARSEEKRAQRHSCSRRYCCSWPTASRTPAASQCLCRKARRDPLASELRSMTNGYRIDSYTAFPFIWRRRHPPTHSQYASKAAVLWLTASGSSVDANDQEYTNVGKAASSHAAHGGETITMGGGSSIELKVESSQSGGDYGVVLWTVRAGEEPPLHTHSREDELVYVVQGQLVARVGDTRVEVGTGRLRGFPAVRRIRSRWSAIRRPCWSASCRVGLSASWSPGTASGPTRPLSG